MHCLKKRNKEEVIFRRGRGAEAVQACRALQAMWCAQLFEEWAEVGCCGHLTGPDSSRLAGLCACSQGDTLLSVRFGPLTHSPQSLSLWLHCGKAQMPLDISGVSHDATQLQEQISFME